MDKKWCDLFEYLQGNEDTRQRNSLNLPRVIAAKKMKFLIAICATDQLDESTDDVTIDDENLPLDKVFDDVVVKPGNTSIPFDDSIVVNDFMNIKKPDFDLKMYISCVKRLYSNNVKTVDMCYLLSHARDFSMPQKPLFTFSNHGTIEVKPRFEEPIPLTCRQSLFTVKLMALMDNLLVKYSEEEYQQLNLNVTYMLLFMTRKFFKNKSHFKNNALNLKTHEHYVNLCPKALSDRLPDDTPFLNNEVLRKGDNGMLFTLILYSYMNSTRLTERVLETTCIAHMEYTGLGLPKMFDELLELYGVTEARLWDAFCVEKSACRSMFALADFHDMQRQGEEQVPPKTYTLFPYCRLLDRRYHHDLSSNIKKNYVACYAMAYLIDKKIGMDKSFARKAFWTRKLKRDWTMLGEEVAAAVYGKINK